MNNDAIKLRYLEGVYCFIWEVRLDGKGFVADLILSECSFDGEPYTMPNDVVRYVYKGIEVKIRQGYIGQRWPVSDKMQQAIEHSVQMRTHEGCNHPDVKECGTFRTIPKHIERMTDSLFRREREGRWLPVPNMPSDIELPDEPYNPFGYPEISPHSPLHPDRIRNMFKEDQPSLDGQYRMRSHLVAQRDLEKGEPVWMPSDARLVPVEPAYDLLHGLYVLLTDLSTNVFTRCEDAMADRDGCRECRHCRIVKFANGLKEGGYDDDLQS